jgi:hypothetical protein
VSRKGSVRRHHLDIFLERMRKTTTPFNQAVYIPEFISVRIAAAYVTCQNEGVSVIFSTSNVGQLISGGPLVR